MFKTFFGIFDKGVVADIKQNMPQNEQRDEAAPTESYGTENCAPKFAEKVVIQTAIIFIKTIRQEQAQIVVQLA